ncbi:unnamed protein product, partial [Amoebophrya sp. A120]
SSQYHDIDPSSGKISDAALSHHRVQLVTGVEREENGNHYGHDQQKTFRGVHQAIDVAAHQQGSNHAAEQDARSPSAPLRRLPGPAKGGTPTYYS